MLILGNVLVAAALVGVITAPLKVENQQKFVKPNKDNESLKKNILVDKKK